MAISPSPTAAADSGHAHPAHLQHHFVSSEQQFSAAKMGMWMFLVTEVLLFSGMFVAYMIYRGLHPEVFKAASVLLDTRLGALNTVILLASSLTAALSVRSAALGRQKHLFIFLALTLVFAAAFMVVKYFEYTHKFHLGIFPGASYTYPDLQMEYVPIFFSIYYVMTGIHGVHVLVGMGIFTWLIVRARRGAFTREYYTPVELSALYWHLVDIIWIFLFPLLYLI